MPASRSDGGWLIYFFFFLFFFVTFAFWNSATSDFEQGVNTEVSDAHLNDFGLFFAFLFGGIGLLFARAINGTSTGSKQQNTTAGTVAAVGVFSIHQRNKHNRELEEMNEKMDDFSEGGGGEAGGADPGGFDPSSGGFF